MAAPRIAALLPGLALCAAVAIAATILEHVEIALLDQRYLESLVLALLIGIVIRTAWRPPALFAPGLTFSAKTLLETAVVLVGAALSAATVFALGPILIVGIAAIVGFAIATSYLIGRALGLRPRLALLVACGNSICGNSAIAAVAPVIGADSDDVAASIAFTAVLGVIVVLLLPLLAPLLTLTVTQYGVLAGLTVYAVPQVLAATLPIGALANQVGTVVKLVRVLMLGPVVLGLSLLMGARRPAGAAANAQRRALPPFSKLVPWFILGFLAAATLRSLGLIPLSLLPVIAKTAGVLTTLAMAALGLDVDIRIVARAGLPVTAAVIVSLLLLTAMSLALISIAGVS